MPTLEVRPRDTPVERSDPAVEIPVDDATVVHAATIEDWTAPRQNWDFVLQGHEFGLTSNVEGRIL
jgi:hypothetical protein